VILEKEERALRDLKKFRTMLGLTQYELGKKARIERSRISLLERGQILASETETAALERALRAARRDNEAQLRRLSGTEADAA
jgi:predicted transcriptional regulator